MTSFARIEDERLFLDRCDQLYQRVQNIKARVDNSPPVCMYGSYLGKRNELRKSLRCAGSSGVKPSTDAEIEIPKDATIERKIENFFLQINYRNTPRTRKKRFPYLKQAAKRECAPEAPTDLMDAHPMAFTKSYPRILRHSEHAESKLRQMPLLYQRVSISSSEEAEDQSDQQSATSCSERSASCSSEASSSASGEKSPTGTADDVDHRQSADNESGRNSYLSDNESSCSSSSSISSRSFGCGRDRGSGSSGSSVSTCLLSDHAHQQAKSISTESSISCDSLKGQQTVEKPPLQTFSAAAAAAAAAAAKQQQQQQQQQKLLNESHFAPNCVAGANSPVPSLQEGSNADTTHGIPPMESTVNSPLNEGSDCCVNFLNDITDVILGMNMFSSSAIEAAIDAILATNLYGDLDKERARFFVDQLFI